MVDQTGLTGRYGLWVTLDADSSIVGGQEYSLPRFDEIPQELSRMGCELKRAVAPIDYYTIQAVHPPTPN